jgi:hypothetical protein
MSLLLVGPENEVQKLQYFITNHKALSLANDKAITPQYEELSELLYLENKYFTAEITIGKKIISVSELAAHNSTVDGSSKNHGAKEETVVSNGFECIIALTSSVMPLVIF